MSMPQSQISPFPQSGWHRSEEWAEAFGYEIDTFHRLLNDFEIPRAKVGQRTFVRADRIAAFLDSIEDTNANEKKQKKSKS